MLNPAFNFNLLYGDGYLDKVVKVSTETQADEIAQMLRIKYSMVQLWRGIEKLRSY